MGLEEILSSKTLICMKKYLANENIQKNYYIF